MEPFAENRKARHDYETLETFEGGIVLSGQEVKSIRHGGANLLGAHVSLQSGELWLKGVHIAPYAKAGTLDAYDPDRPRKVLLRKRELLGISGKMQQKGLTLVPFTLYPHGRHIKLRFSLCRGRKAHSKKEMLKRRDITRELRRGDDEH
jgi:SsrA-binding protein